jgi:hypothetical protein
MFVGESRAAVRTRQTIFQDAAGPGNQRAVGKIRREQRERSGVKDGEGKFRQGTRLKMEGRAT